MSLKRRHAITILYLVSVFFLYSFTFSHFSAATHSENSSLLKYEVDDAFVGSLKHIIRIDNPTSERVIGKLFVPIIRNETARHYILYNITSLKDQLTISKDNSGNIYACWSNVTIGEKQTFTVEINYYVLSFSIRYLINSSRIADYDKSSDLYKKYTQPEELIQSNNSKIVWKAQNITNGENNIHGKVFRIYNFVITHMSYVVQENEMGALWALENRTGDCSEYSYLFVALCRAAGIPARVQAGFAFHTSSETLKDGHMWAEYYLENYGWIPVDATWRQFDLIDKRHFSSIRSMSEVIPYANYFFNCTIGPEPADNQTVLLKPCSPSVFGDDFFAENVMEAIQRIK
ncbi:MAG: transglutaminase-like domain-containing protein, partial [Candidatus Bathyarchaeales archaeon]